jgi:hypothetical protein
MGGATKLIPTVIAFLLVGATSWQHAAALQAGGFSLQDCRSRRKLWSELVRSPRRFGVAMTA